jgi:hypothetical protein
LAARVEAREVGEAWDERRLVPADRYYGRVDEVLARTEVGAGRDPGDLLDLRERCLKLFKITSKGGVAEVWLLGERLLGLPTGARS